MSFVCWIPRLVREQVAEADVFLEVLDPLDELDLTVAVRGPVPADARAPAT